jgi:hypothetical protein
MTDLIASSTEISIGSIHAPILPANLLSGVLFFQKLLYFFAFDLFFFKEQSGAFVENISSFFENLPCFDILIIFVKAIRII